jgi:VanZ family protein
MMRWHLIFVLLSILWMSIIFYLSSRHSIVVPSVILAQDKLAHAGAFGVLGALYTCTWIQPGQKMRCKQMLIVVTLVGLYGWSDEFHQSFVQGRDSDLWDWVADVLGGFIAVMMTGHLLQHLRLQQPKMQE